MSTAACCPWPRSSRRSFSSGPASQGLEAFDLAEPAFAFSLGNAGDQAVADVGEPCPSGRIDSKE
ncbi:hypothetical protein [Streptomyces sp. NPDC018352]|uniref:hypothetical protein n=1 Tax=Streptomyces sp. NPDC018352 TaxID=3157194 RepID=UPI0033FA9D42